MNYTQLKAFHAVAQENSFTKGAERLRLTQPAITIQVRELEKRYGLKLFDRLNGTCLTSEGENLFAITSELFQVESKAAEFLNGSKQLKIGILKLSADSVSLALPLIQAFQKSYPLIDVQLKLGNAKSVWEDLYKQRADVIIVANHRHPSSILTKTMQKQNVIACVAKDHPLSKKTDTSLQELQQYPVIRRENQSNTQKIIDQACNNANIELKSTLQIANREAVHEAVAQNMGVGFFLNKDVVPDPRIHSLPLRDIAHQSEDVIAYARSQKDRTLIKTFVAMEAF